MRFLKFVATLSIITGGMCAVVSAVQADDPVNKLGAFLGKWDAQTTLIISGAKAGSKIECRWTPTGSFLICEQQASDGMGLHRQVTVYGYDHNNKIYVFTSLTDQGAPPSHGTIEIKDAIWTYSSSFAATGGKTNLFKTTYDFSSPGIGKFKTERSDDGSAHWQTVLEGTAKKIAD
jgi:hypothetical protein